MGVQAASAWAFGRKRKERGARASVFLSALHGWHLLSLGLTFLSLYHQTVAPQASGHASSVPPFKAVLQTLDHHTLVLKLLFLVQNLVQFCESGGIWPFSSSAEGNCYLWIRGKTHKQFHHSLPLPTSKANSSHQRFSSRPLAKPQQGWANDQLLSQATCKEPVVIYSYWNNR